MVKSRRCASSSIDAGVGDDRAAPVGLDVAAEGGHLEGRALDDHRDRAVIEPGRHRVEPGAPRASAVTRSGGRVGGDVDIGDRRADERVAHAAADEPGLVAGLHQHRADRLRRGAGEPGVGDSGGHVRKPFRERPQDPGGGAPDVIGPVGHGVELAPARRGRTAIRRCNCAGSATWSNGTVNTSSTSPGLRHRRERSGDPPQHRGDAEAGHRLVRRHRAKHLDLAARQADLFLRLAQRGGQASASPASILPPGKAIWPGWCFRPDDLLVR